jgi:hypothetical protein
MEMIIVGTPDKIDEIREACRHLLHDPNVGATFNRTSQECGVQEWELGEDPDEDLQLILQARQLESNERMHKLQIESDEKVAAIQAGRWTPEPEVDDFLWSTNND